MLAFNAVCTEILDSINTPQAPMPERIHDNTKPLLDLARDNRVHYYLAKWLLTQYSDSLPAAFQAGLTKELVKNKTRNALLLDQILQLARLFRDESIPVMFLKGAAGLLYGIYDIECRYLSDIDMLVPDEKIPEAEDLLVKNGYSPEKDTIVPENHHHIIPYYNKHAVGGLEIHREPYGLSMRDRPALPDIWKNAVTLEKDTTEVTVPSLLDHTWIIMRSEALNGIFFPKMKETTELAEVLRYGPVDFDMLQKRAEKDAMPGLVTGYACSLTHLFGIYLPCEYDTSAMRSWRRWSRDQQARMRKNGDRFKASRIRFGAVRFLASPGLAGKLRLNRRIIRYDIEQEQVTNPFSITLIILKNLVLHLFWFVDSIRPGMKKYE